jgi:uncharacterized membrane protein YdjX (TVP38/TMEM64 family)
VGGGQGGGRSAARLAALLVGVAALATMVILLPVQAWLSAAVEWIAGLGPWGPLALAGLYVVACVLLVPGSVLTLGAGAAFGVVVGFVTVSLAATAGAAAAFLVGRHLARDQVASRVAGNPRFAAVDRAVGREGFKIVLLTRLSPLLPFNVQNYAYGLTDVSFRDYVLASWLGMIPGTILYVSLGYAGREAATAGEGRARTPGEWALLGVGLAATVAVTVYVTRLARRALDRELPDTPRESGD